MVITKAPCTESDGRLATPLHTFPSSLPSIPAHMTRAWTEEMMVAYKAAFSILGFVSAGICAGIPPGITFEGRHGYTGIKTSIWI